jgi:hypothetical protein
MRGYFSARIELGTPPRPFDLIVDTGSSLTYVTCSGCYPRCGKHANAPFDPSQSSTAKEVPCKAGECLCGTSCADSCPLPLPPMMGGKSLPVSPAGAAHSSNTGGGGGGEGGKNSGSSNKSSSGRKRRRRLHGDDDEAAAPSPSRWSALRALMRPARLFVTDEQRQSPQPRELAEDKDSQSWRGSNEEAAERRAERVQEQRAEMSRRQQGGGGADLPKPPPEDKQEKQQEQQKKVDNKSAAAPSPPPKNAGNGAGKKPPATTTTSKSGNPAASCTYAVFYAEGSSTTGRVISDVLHVPVTQDVHAAAAAKKKKAAAGKGGGGGGGGVKEAAASPSPSPAYSSYHPRVQFGCADTEDGMLRSQAADGILGLGNSAETVVGQLAGSGATAGAGFGVCLSHPSGGAVLLGAAADDPAALKRAVGVTGEMKYAPLLRDRHFAVQGGRMLLDGAPIPVADKPPPPGSDEAKKRREEALGKEVAARLSPAARAIEDSAAADERALWDSYYDAGAPKSDGDPLSLGRTIVDSGATWSYLPFGKAIALERALQRVADTRPPEKAPRLRRMPPDFLPEELCWRAQPDDMPASEVYKAFPKLTIELSEPGSGGLAIDLNPEAYLYPLYDVEVPADSEGARAAAAAQAAAQAQAEAMDAEVEAAMAADRERAGERSRKEEEEEEEGRQQGGGLAGGGGLRVSAAQAERQRQQQGPPPAGAAGAVAEPPPPPPSGSASPRGRRRLTSSSSSGPPPPPSVAAQAQATRRLTMGDIANEEVKGVYCLGFMRSAEEWSLLGGAALRGRLTHFDLSGQRLGLATATCRIDPGAVASLGGGVGAAASSSSSSSSSKAEMLKAESGGGGGSNGTAAAAPLASLARGGGGGGGRRLLSASAGAAVATLMARAAA